MVIIATDPFFKTIVTGFNYELLFVETLRVVYFYVLLHTSMFLFQSDFYRNA